MELRLCAHELSQTPGGLNHSHELFRVSFDWRGPRLHTIMGVSGAGKSSLLKTLAGIWEPRGGKLLFGEHKHGSPEAAYLRQTALSYAFQNNALFNSLSNFENLAFPHRLRFPEITEADRGELVMEWLGRVELQQSARLMPHELSGGMQKRLGIARAMILNPKYIFLDDPTAGLDPITSRTIAELLRSFLDERESMSLLVTNDLQRAQQWGGELHFLHEGRLISKGSDDYKAVEESFS